MKVTLNYQHFYAAFKACVATARAANDSSNPILTGIYVRADENGQTTVISSDSIVGTIIKLPAIDDTAIESGEITFHANDVAMLPKPDKRLNAPIEIESDGKTVSYSYMGTSGKFLCIVGTYPHDLLERFEENEQEQAIQAFSASEMEKILKACKAGGINDLTFYHGQAPLKIAMAKGKTFFDSDARFVISPLRRW